MAQSRLNVIILGDSLAARVAASSAAKKGERVLTLSTGRPPAHPWLFLSGALEDFLGRLGGRSCLTTPLPLQIVTASTRTEIHGSLPLADELKREFPAGHLVIEEILSRLEDLGERLEETVKAAGSLPLHGPASRLRFARAAMARRISLRALNRPFCLNLERCADLPSRVFLRALMEGLSLRKAEELTEGEAALLWRSALQPRSISASAFDAFLKQRYEQFHGRTEELSKVASLDVHRGSVDGVTFKDGRRVSADYYLLASPEAIDLLPEPMRPVVSQPPASFSAELKEKRVSSLIAPRVILSTELLLRVTLSPVGGGALACRAQTLSGTASSTEQVQQQLSTLFPFAALELKQKGAPLPSARQPDIRRGLGAFPGAKAGIRMKKNLLNCCARSVFPSLGSVGEVLLGLSCAERIVQAKKS